MMKHLFSPFETANLKLKNRIVMAPMTRSFSPGHVPNQQTINYYRRRAENEVGLIITEGTCVGHPAANGYPDVPFFYGADALSGWQQVVDAVHEAGGKIMPQLWHVGGVRKDCLQPDESVPAYSPSGMLSPNRTNGQAMTPKDIDEVIVAFVEAAVEAQKLGFDGVEIHGAHGYLLDQFFWDKTNLRTDRYGGDLQQRTQFAVELITAMRDAVGKNFPIQLRYSQWKLQNYQAKLATNPQELEIFLTPLVDAGVDVFHCSTRRFWEPEFAHSDLNLAGWTKKITGLPTITVGSVGLAGGFVDEKNRGMVNQMDVSTAELIQLEQAIERGDYDMVAVGRALLQDPQWGNKLKAGNFTQMQAYQASSLKQLY